MKKLLKITLFLSVIVNIAIAQVPSYVPTNGLVGWWPFNANANDGSGNANNGTVNGATLTTDRFGNGNSAYQFNGNGKYIDLGSAGLVTNPDTCSFSVWTLVDSLYTGLFGQTSVIMTKRHVDGGPSWTTIQINSDSLVNLCVDRPSTISNISHNKKLINQWVNIVVIKKHNNYSLFVNGILIKDTTVSYSQVGSTNNMHVGHSGAWNTFYYGKIDDIGIWNRALTESEITSLYNANICIEKISVTDTLVINVGRTGYNPITYNNTIKVYPNPTNDKITIDNGDITKLNGYSLKIMNSLGQQVFQGTINQQQFNIDITTWGGNGMYFLHVIDATGNTIDVRKILLK